MPDQTAEIARSLKEITHHLKAQNRILETISESLMTLRPKPSVTPPPEPTEEVKSVPKCNIYGWSVAALMQREGQLKIGDMKIEADDSHWLWTGEAWERVEAPSARPPD